MQAAGPRTCAGSRLAGRCRAQHASTALKVNLTHEMRQAGNFRLSDGIEDQSGKNAQILTAILERAGLRQILFGSSQTCPWADGQCIPLGSRRSSGWAGSEPSRESVLYGGWLKIFSMYNVAILSWEHGSQLRACRPAIGGWKVQATATVGGTFPAFRGPLERHELWSLVVEPRSGGGRLAMLSPPAAAVCLIAAASS